MKTKIFIIIAVCIGTIISCQAMSRVVDVGAQVAGATGVINQNTAAAISVSARAIGSAAEEITPEQEYYIGRAVAANILTTYRLWKANPALTAYLNHICAAIVINSPRPDVFNGYRVAILDTNEINAFATPGGHIFLTRGLINSSTSEDTLAAVIAHELAHIQLAHGYAIIKQSRLNQAFGQAAKDVSGAAGKDFDKITETFGLSVDVVVTALLNGYSREQEFEADSTAMSLLDLSGYEPSSLMDVLRVLERNQPGRPGGFNKTHPTPAQRIDNANKTVGNYSVPDTRSYREVRYRAVR